ncbi:hypothetical protein [Comamonas sp. 4034]|uniref:hypothetical protein n=1 Tax=Comamonas sp. 4034 TaxID=3156455 RepID=UPI003D19DCEC
MSKEEAQARYDKEHISYPNGKPDTHLTWIGRPAYVGNELSYRGQAQKAIVTLNS